MSEGTLDAAAVEAALDALVDPETGRSVVKMRQLRDVRVEDGKVALTLQLTTFSAPLWDATRRKAEQLLRDRFDSIRSVEIDVCEHERPPEKLGEIGLTAKSVIAVGSGKGGVGKSTVAAGIALGLKRAGCRVGLLDADVYGPSIPHLFGIEQRPQIVEQRIQPVEAAGMPIMSMGLLVPADEAVIWRGPMLHGAITQFLRDTEWGELDYLIIDMPPGTGDVALSLSQLLPLTGAVVVCTPQAVALLDAVKAIAMFQKVNIPVLGMVENMSGFLCPDNGKRYDIFGRGGARQKAEQLNVPFLGDVPITMEIRTLGDQGQCGALYDDPQAAPYFEQICLTLTRHLADSRAESPPMPTLTVL